MSATEIIFEITEDEVDGGIRQLRLGTVSTRKVTPLTISVATSGKPLSAISTMACLGRS